MRRPTRSLVPLLLAAAVIALAGCGSDSEDDSAAAGTDSTTSESEAPTEGAGDTGDTEPEDGGTEAPAGEAGSGFVTVDGVEYPDFAGTCSISRGVDPETYLPIEVGDLAEPGLNATVGIDNVASSPEVEANFIMASFGNFRMTGIGGDGTIDSVAYVESGTPGDVAEVAFSGRTDTGESVVVQIFCEIGLG